MYLPAQFNRPEYAADMMHAHPFASLVSADGEGFPFVTHLPPKLIGEGDSPSALLGHWARANPHVQYLSARTRVLAGFMGPQAYMSPKADPNLHRVLTWTYLAVHARLKARCFYAVQFHPAVSHAVQGQALPSRFPSFCKQMIFSEDETLISDEAVIYKRGDVHIIQQLAFGHEPRRARLGNQRQ